MKIVMSWEECLADTRECGFSEAADSIKRMLDRGSAPICGQCEVELEAAHVHLPSEGDLWAACNEGCAIQLAGVESMEVPG